MIYYYHWQAIREQQFDQCVKLWSWKHYCDAMHAFVVFNYHYCIYRS